MREVKSESHSELFGKKGSPYDTAFIFIVR